MYIINKDENRIAKLEEKTFHELKFKEREHLHIKCILKGSWIMPKMVREIVKE
ncbi:MAG: hypothetical protein JXR60_11495 [Bacteroidales bacterium]|nr:hypothetical protein [Bacteroidales bacterium]